MSTLNKIQHSFRRSLQTYDGHAFVQLEIAETLAKMLSELQPEPTGFQKVYEVGCGTGFLTKALLQFYQVRQYGLNDLVAECEAVVSSFLQELSSERLTHWQFTAGDINQMEIAEQHDLICSASTVQWVPDLSTMLQKIHQALNPRGWLALSSFGPEHFVELRELNRDLGYQAEQLSYASESQWQQLLQDGFDVKVLQSNEVTLWFDSFAEVLQHLRNTGVNGNARQQWNQTRLKEFERAYHEAYEKEGKLPLSYEPVYIIAQKKV